MLLTKANTSHIKLAYKGLFLNFLVNTGANVSLIKWEKLQNTNTSYESSEILSLNGLSANSPVMTAGIVNLVLSIHNKSFNAKFQVVKENCNIPFDGLIGNDILKHENAIIDYEKSRLKLSSLPFTIPLQLKSDVSNPNAIFLQPRSETLIEVDILNASIGEGVCPNN